MRVLLVTSQITYVPRNYLDLFDELFSNSSQHIAGLIILKNLSPAIIAKAAGLWLMGCKGISRCLLRNVAELPLRRREKLFQRQGLPVQRVGSMNDPNVVRWVSQQEFDWIVNLRTRCIYKEDILSAPKQGCMNIHHGILPDYRGTLCDLYALSEGRPAGFTIHNMNKKIDAGRIFVRKEISVPGETNYIKYLSRSGKEEGRALSDLLNQISESGCAPEGMQNNSENPVFTRNPNRRQVAEMIHRGMIL